MSNIFQHLHETSTRGPAAVLCIVVSTLGSVPRRAGAKMMVYADGSIEGTIGGGATEFEVINRALQMQPGEAPQVLSFDLKPEHGLACGGQMQVYLERITPTDRLLIFGAGHIGKELASMASGFGFRITLVDDREGIFNPDDQLRYQCIADSYPNIPASLNIGADDYVVVATYEHRLDIEITAAAAANAPRYIGLIGSKGKIALARKRFVEEFHLSNDLINRIEMPIGVAIATETPREIALAIMASLVDARNRNRGLKPKK